MKKSKVGQELYSLAEALTGTAFTLIFAVALFALLFAGVSTFGHYEQKTHEEPITYEEYHRGMASDTPVQFYAVSAEAALYTSWQQSNTTNYYVYITMEDAKGNQVVTVMQRSSSAITPNDDPLAALKLDAGSFVDEINGKAGTLYYGVISDNSLDKQAVLTDPMVLQNMDEIEAAARQRVREKAQIEELQTLELYTGDAPQSTTVVDGTEFVRGGGSWFLLGAAVLLALYIVMWIIRKTGKNAAEQRMAEMTHQAKLHLQEIEQRAVAEAASKFKGPKIVVDIAAVGLFKNRTDIEVVEVLPGVGIHANEFQGCTNLRQISLPDGLMGIGSYAFQDCKSLKDITLPNSNMLIGSNAFSGCTALEHIKIGVLTCFIYENAFEGCEKLIVEAPYGTFPISEFRELLKETAKTVSPEKSPSDNYVAAWTKEMERQVDIRRKAAEKTAQKAEKPAIIVTPIQLRFVQKSAKYYDGENAQWVMEYTSNREYSFMEIVKVFQNIPSTSIDVYEDADVGLKTVAGTYDMDHFMKDYGKIACSDIEEIIIDTEYQQKGILIKMWPQSTSIKLCIIEESGRMNWKSWGKQTLQFVESMGQQIMQFIANGGENR